MFRKMRRSAQELPFDEAVEILTRNTSGTLALLGDDDYPYALPMSYVYSQGRLYFHSAKSGHKIDAAAKHSKASFCVIDMDRVVPEKYTTHFRSAIAFGRLNIIKDPGQMRPIVTKLAMKYSSAFQTGIEEEINSSINNMVVIEMVIEHISAKKAIELS